MKNFKSFSMFENETSKNTIVKIANIFTKIFNTKYDNLIKDVVSDIKNDEFNGTPNFEMEYAEMDTDKSKLIRSIYNRTKDFYDVVSMLHASTPSQSDYIFTICSIKLKYQEFSLYLVYNPERKEIYVDNYSTTNSSTVINLSNKNENMIYKEFLFELEKFLDEEINN